MKKWLFPRRAWEQVDKSFSLDRNHENLFDLMQIAWGEKETSEWTDGLDSANELWIQCFVNSFVGNKKQSSFPNLQKRNLEKPK